MEINRITLVNYRKYSNRTFNFQKGINILCGDNAVGKTSILEAIGFLITCRTFKNASNKEIIKQTESVGGVSGSFSVEKTQKNAKLLISNNYKKITLDNCDYKKVSDYVGFVKVVTFDSGDVNTIVGTPANKRKIFDFMMCQIDKEYLFLLKKYKKTIKEKSSLLRRSFIDNRVSHDLLDVLDKEIFDLIVLLNKKRIKFIEDINSEIKNVYKEFENNKESGQIRLKQSFPLGGSFKDYTAYRAEEIKTQTCMVGPHRDDYIFYLNDVNIINHASQGQIKTFAICLKLAYSKLIMGKTGAKPIVLLDDIFGELDAKRQNSIIKMLDVGTQTIITTPSLTDIDKEILCKANIIYLEKEE